MAVFPATLVVPLDVLFTRRVYGLAAEHGRLEALWKR
jgi:hypothetical protein